MQNLGFTRSSWQRDHLLMTPDTFVRAPLPGMEQCTAIVHAAPAMGAAFTQYTAEFEAGGRLGPCAVQRFVYVLDGTLHVDGRSLAAGEYAYLPEAVSAVSAARAAVIEKPYTPIDGAQQPARFTGSAHEAATRP